MSVFSGIWHIEPVVGTLRLASRQSFTLRPDLHFYELASFVSDKNQVKDGTSKLEAALHLQHVFAPFEKVHFI